MTLCLWTFWHPCKMKDILAQSQMRCKTCWLMTNMFQRARYSNSMEAAKVFLAYNPIYHYQQLACSKQPRDKHVRGISECRQFRISCVTRFSLPPVLCFGWIFMYIVSYRKIHWASSWVYLSFCRVTWTSFIGLVISGLLAGGNPSFWLALWCLLCYLHWWTEPVISWWGLNRLLLAILWCIRCHFRRARYLTLALSLFYRAKSVPPS